jgi:hypothetical protein
MNLRAIALTLGALAACGTAEESQDTSMPEPAREEAAPELGGTLVVSGEAVESPGTHPVQINCQYSRSPGMLTLSAYSETSRSGHLSITLGNPTPIPLESGTYNGRFSYDEPRSDDRVSSYHGEVEATITVHEGGSFPSVEITARGEESGAEIELDGRCETIGGGA